MIKTKKLKELLFPKIAINEVDLEIAKKLLALPREVGEHPETGEMIIANNGRYSVFKIQ